MTRYRAEPASTIWRISLDAFTILYHRRSGVTHMVTSPVPELLDALADEALTIDDLRARLATEYELSDDSDALVARIDELVATGLVAIA